MYFSYDEVKNQWIAVHNRYPTFHAVSHAGYLLGTQEWTILNDTNLCGSSSYSTELSFSSCSQDQFTCSDGNCVGIDNRSIGWDITKIMSRNVILFQVWRGSAVQGRVWRAGVPPSCPQHWIQQAADSPTSAWRPVSPCERVSWLQTDSVHWWRGKLLEDNSLSTEELVWQFTNISKFEEGQS